MDQKSLELRLANVKADSEVQNLMAKHQYLYAAGMLPECTDLFAKRGDSLVHFSWGCYKGWDSINNLYTNILAKTGPDSLGPGVMYEHGLMTPCIQVAGDGETAKGAWWSMGHEAAPENATKGAPIRAYWSYVKFAADFIKDGDAWYLWHLAYIGMFSTEYHKSWVDRATPPEGVEWTISKADLKPDAPPFIADNSYSQKTMYRKYLPASPEPYETYDEEEGLKWCNPKVRRKSVPKEYKGVTPKTR